MQFKKPNLKAPRYWEKTLNPLTRSFFSELRKQHPELKGFTDSKIRNVIKISNEQIYKDMLEFRDGVEFPEFLGFGFIGTCPKKVKPNIDYKLSAEYRQLIEHRNWESDNYLASIFYTNYETKYKFKFHQMWGFTPSRNFSRTVSKQYPLTWKKYIQVDHTSNIAKLFRIDAMTYHQKKKTEELLETYDEFGGF